MSICYCVFADKCLVRMRIIQAINYDDLSKKAANIMAAQVLLNPCGVLGLATGSSPIGLYKELINWCKRGELDFSGVKTINLDEYVGLAPQNDQSYRYFMKTNLFDHININQKNCYVPDGLATDGVAEGKRYDAIISDMGGVDMQLLGIGLNGHIAFNEPCEWFEKGTYRVALTQSTINANARFFATIDDVPKEAYTMGAKSIMQAKKILMIISGESKAQILYDAFFGKVTPMVPASILQFHSDVTVVADEAALSIVKAKGLC